MNNSKLYNFFYVKNFLFGLFFFVLPLSKGISNTLIFTLLILYFVEFSSRNVKQKIIENFHLFSYIFLFLLLLVGLFYSENLKEGFKIIRHHHRFLIIPLLFVLHSDYIQSKKYKFLFIFVSGAFVHALFPTILYSLDEQIVQKLSENTPFFREYPKNHNRLMFGLYSPFVDRIQLSNILGISTLICLYLVYKNQYRIWLYGTFSFLIFTMLLLGGRGGQIALLFGLITITIILTFEYYKIHLSIWKRISILFFIPIFMFSVSFLLYKTNDAVQKRYNQIIWELNMMETGNYTKHNYIEFTSIRRLVSWKNMFELAKENVLFGVGTGDYSKEIQRIYEHDKFEYPVNTHSQYLYYWCLVGLSGLLLFLFSLFLWTRRLSLENKSIGMAFLVFYLTSMFFDAVLLTTTDSILFLSMFSFIGLKTTQTIKNEN